MSSHTGNASTTFTYHDPSRSFSGTPYEAAGQAVDQSRRVLLLLARALKDTGIQTRNAYMSRRLDLGEDDPAAFGWEDEPEAKTLRFVMFQISNMERALVGLDKKLQAVGKAAAYDPTVPDES